MSKIVLNDIGMNYSPIQINNNFQKIEDVLNDQVFFRDVPEGEPNELENNLDANGFRIINLPAPVTEGEPARKKDVIDSSLVASEALQKANAAQNEIDNVGNLVEIYLEAKE